MAAEPLVPDPLPPKLPDVLTGGLSVVFCGLNPGLSAVVSGHHFTNKSNRFWKAIHLAGFTAELIEPTNDRRILQYGCGLTVVVDRPTIRADEVSRQEFQASHGTLHRKIELFAPAYIAFLGKAAYSAISGRRDIAWGLQPERFAGAVAWVLPNPSGLNRAFRLDDLVQAYRELRLAAF
ncbi:G/U mismatch-specific DNA glycosylase [Candidimonas nitroreducens]|uniref:Double-stranded uracil-DNA glycosylase n=1 Tax=Candidimonas nitroreducens TaxID=683354 RepID=A0A225MD09_9BURK|nr:G/U mismatch-specific DNA glycosylase [Candidimonas nitroreducens]OWT59184.1 double-stranded uracil-DNA glycosylase [Candidimonas nitroreducens]